MKRVTQIPLKITWAGQCDVLPVGSELEVLGHRESWGASRVRYSNPGLGHPRMIHAVVPTEDLELHTVEMRG